MAKIIGQEESSDVSTPGTGNRALYPKSDGWYDKDDAGVVTGPFGTGGAGNWTLIQDINLSSGNGAIDFTSIPGTYKSLRIVGQVRTTDAAAGVELGVRFNNDSAGNYNSIRFSITHSAALGTAESLGGTSIKCAACNGDGAPASYYSPIEMFFPDYADTNIKHSMQAFVSSMSAISTGNLAFQSGQGSWTTASTAISRITLISVSGGTFKQYSHASLYGLS